MRYDITTTAYRLDYGKPILYIWARDENGKKYQFKKSTARPHFFIRPDEKELISNKPDVSFGSVRKDLFGESVVEVFTRKPAQVGYYRRELPFSKTWEADVRFPLAMLVEMGVYASFELDHNNKMVRCEPHGKPLRIGTADFEVLAPPQIFPEPEEAEYPMISAAWHDNYTNEWHVFAWHDSIEKEDHYDKWWQPPERSKGEQWEKILVHYHFFTDEAHFFAGMTNWVVDCNFDVLTGWNFNSFDMLTWYNRTEMLAKQRETPVEIRKMINIERLSPIGATFKRAGFNKTFMSKARSEVQSSGKVLFDGLTAYKKVMVARGELESYSLAYVSEYELDVHRVVEQQHDLWESGDVERLANYPIRDIFLTKEVMDKRSVITYFDKIRKKTGCRLEDAITNSKILDAFCLHKAHDMGFVLPSKPRGVYSTDYKKNKKKANFEGAIVLQPKRGRHRNVGVVDFSSHYPNSMISYNMSPETLVYWRHKESRAVTKRYEVGKEDEYVATEPGRPHILVGNGVAFYNDVKGFVPLLLEELAVERKFYTDQMDRITEEEHSTSGTEWDGLFWLQFAVKFINTAFYGVFAYVGFRLYLIEMPDSTTFIGRKFMRLGINYTNDGMTKDYVKEFYGDDSVKYLEERGEFFFEVIYGDTDSFFLTLPEPSVELMEWAMVKINELNKQLAAELKLRKTPLLKAERIFKSLILKDAKKRYFGEMVWKDGAYFEKDDPKRFQVKGFEAKRSDTSRYSQKMQKAILIALAEFASEKETYALIRKAHEDIKKLGPHTTVEEWMEFGIPKGVNPLTMVYLNVPRTRGARYAWLYYDKQVMQFQKPKRIYLKWMGAMVEETWWEATDVISFDNPENLPLNMLEYIDYAQMINVCVTKKLEDLLDAVGMDIKMSGVGQTSMKMFFV